MALSKLVRQMNRSLETKLAIYADMEEYVGQRPVIFTSRAEIWLTDTNPVIISGFPFPSVSPSDNPNPGDLTQEMTKYYRNLPKAKEKGGHHLTLILFQFRVRGSTEVHAIFFRGESDAKDIPAEIYLKNLAPTEVLIRQCSTDSKEEKTSRTSVPMVLAGESVDALPASIDAPPASINASPASISSGVNLRRFSRRLSLGTTSEDDRDVGPIESMVSPDLGGNVDRKVKRSFDSVRSGPSITSSSLVSAEYRCYSSPTMEGRLECYERRDVKVERSLRNLISSFEALCAGSVDESDKYDYSISCSSTFSTDSDECQKILEKLRAIISRLSRPLMVNLDKKLKVYEDRRSDAKYLAHIFTNDDHIWKTDRNPIIEISELPPIPQDYDHEKNDIIQDIVEYIRLNHIMMKWPDSEPIYVATLRIETGIYTEVHIVLSQHADNASKYYLRTGLRPTLGPPSSRSSSMPMAAPLTLAGLSDVRSLTRQAAVERELEDYL